MMAVYCNITTDLDDVFDRIESYNVRTRLPQKFVVDSGSRYKLEGSGSVQVLFEDGVKLTEAASQAAVDASGEWYYDATNDVLYVQATDDADPDTHDMERLVDWETFKTRMRNEAMAELDAMLDARFPRPLPESRNYHTSDKFDIDIKVSCAYLTCARIIGRIAANMPVADRLRKMVTNEDKTGIIDLHNSGARVFSWEVSPDELGHFGIEANSSNTGSGFIELKGLYTGAADEVWEVEMDASGAVGTATFKWSRDGGTTYVATTKATDNEWISLQAGISIRFWDRGSTFASGDKWEIHMVSESEREDIVRPPIHLARA